MTGKLDLETMHAIPYVVSRSPDCFIRTTQDMLDILSWGAERGTNLYLFEEFNFSPEFYDLSTGLAGEILQKCSNYRLKLVIVGSFTGITSLRFREFMTESNRGSQVRFVAQWSEATDWCVSSRTGP